MKDFDGGDKHRFAVPLPPLGIPDRKDEDLKRKTPLWLSYAGEQQYESRIELPKGWSATPPAPIDLKESFADFQGSSEVHEGVLITKRRFLLKARDVTPNQVKSYKAFQKAISDDYNTYIFLHVSADFAAIGAAATPAQGPARVPELMRKALTELPSSTNPEAIQAESDAREAMQRRDRESAIAAIKHAVSLDPKFARAWIELGGMYAGTPVKGFALAAFQKAVEADPKQVVPYKILALAYAVDRRLKDAIATWQKLQSIAPNDHDLASNLGGLYMAQKRYPEAASLFESAAKANPFDAYAELGLGIVRLRSNKMDQGLDALHKALEIDSGAEMLNNVAYEMAEADTNLPDALAYSQRSVKELEDRSQKVDLKTYRKRTCSLR